MTVPGSPWVHFRNNIYMYHKNNLKHTIPICSNSECECLTRSGSTSTHTVIDITVMYWHCHCHCHQHLCTCCGNCHHLHTCTVQCTPCQCVNSCNPGCTAGVPGIHKEGPPASPLLSGPQRRQAPRNRHAAAIRYPLAVGCLVQGGQLPSISLSGGQLS